MRLGLWKTIVINVILTPSVQQAGRLCDNSSLLFFHADTRLTVTIMRIVAKLLCLQFDSGPLHHCWVAKKLQDQRCGGAGCSRVSSKDQLYCCFLQKEKQMEGVRWCIIDLLHQVSILRSDCIVAFRRLCISNIKSES